MSEHTSTHMDSPYHVYPKSWKLDEIPFERLVNVTGVVVDVSRAIMASRDPANYEVTKQDILRWEYLIITKPQRFI